jgi:predicted phage tail protein
MVTKLTGRKSGKGAGAGGFKEDPNTLTTDTHVRAVFLVSEGPVEGLSTGDAKSIYFNDIPLIDTENNYTHQNVAWTFRNGLPDQEHIPGFEGASSINSVNAQVTFSTPVTVAIAGNYDAALVSVSIPALTFTDTTNGVLKGTDLSYAIDVKTATGSYVTVHSVDLIQQKTTSEWRGTYRVDLPEGGSPWSIRVRRLTADSASLDLQNSLYFATYATVQEGKFNYRNSSVLALDLPAKEFNSQVPTVKAKIKGMKVWVPTNYDPVARTYATSGPGTSSGIWDGTFKAAYTNNPAWIFNDLLINDRYALGQDFNPSNDPDSAFVDKWALYTISQFCDELISDGYGGTEPRYTINIQITNRQEAYELLQEIMSTMNGMMYFSAEQITPVIDKPDTLDDIFTQADVAEGLFEYSGTALKTRHSAVVSYYNDKNNLFKRSAVIHEDPELIEQIGYRSVEINNFGCTSRAQALRTAKWLLETEKNQTQTVTFKTGHRGGFVTPGAIIKIFDDYKAGVRLGGRILSYSGTSPNITFTLDKSLTLSTADSFIYINDEGVPVSKSIPVNSITDTFTLTNADGAPVAGGAYAIVKPDLDGQLYRVIAVTEDDKDQYTILALQHDESKFAIIEADPVFGELPTSVITNKKLPTVTDIDIAQWWETVSGTEPFPHITVSWVRPNDPRVIGFEVQLKTITQDYTEVYDGSLTSWDSDRLPSSSLNEYSVRIRCYDNLGRYSDWAYDTDFNVDGKNVAPPVPTNFQVDGIINGYIASWDNPNIPDFKYVEVKEGLTNVLLDATTVSTASNDFYVRQGLLPYNTRYVWIRTVSHAATNNTSAWLGPLEAEAKGVNIADFDDEVTGIPIVDVLPNPVGYSGPPIVFLTTDQKLWTYNSALSAWELTIGEIPPDYNPGIDGYATEPDPAGFEEGDVYYNTTDNKLYIVDGGVWVSISADSDIASGATLPVSGVEGDLFYNTTDGKLYRYHDTGWTAAVEATDIDGQITTTQIEDNAITTAKITADAITAGKISAGAITTAKLAAGAITANELAANAVTAGKIAANAISATEIQSGAITTAKINAGAVTSNELAANSVIAGKIAAGAVTANAIGAGTITVAINLGSSGKIVLDGVNNRLIISD